MFKDRADRLNLLRLNDAESLDSFLDFTRPPAYKNFPIKETALKKVLEPFYDDIQLKSRVICPVPEETDPSKMTIAQKAQAGMDHRSTGNKNFNQQNSLNPPKTLLNLTIKMIDALSVEFALVTDIKVFNSFKSKWFGDRNHSE